MPQTSDASIERFGSGEIKHLLWSFSIPAIASMVAVALYNIIDRIFIGRGVGPMAISGLALTFPLMSLVAAIGTLVGVGASARISIVLGMRDVNWARNILGNALIMAFVLSAVLVTFSMVYLDRILLLFGGSDATIPYAREFLRIVIPGSIFTNLTFSFCGIMRATGFPKKSMYVIMSSVGINLILAPIFILWLKMGIRGAAMATVIAMFCSAVLAISHFFNKALPVHFRWRSFILRGYIMRNVLSIGLAPFLMNVAGSMVNMILNKKLVVLGGDLAIGAYGIINSYAAFILMGVMGLGQGMSPIVGFNYGAQKLKRMKDVLLLTLKYATILTTSGFIIAQVMPSLLVWPFTSDPELTAITVKGMRLAFLAIPIVGFQVIISIFFQAISKPGQAIFMSLSRQVIFLIPSLYFFSQWFGLIGVWLALPFSDTLAFMLSLLFLRRERNVFYPRNF